VISSFHDKTDKEIGLRDMRSERLEYGFVMDQGKYDDA
jgi:hypothetical protein